MKLTCSSGENKSIRPSFLQKLFTDRDHRFVIYLTFSGKRSYDRDQDFSVLSLLNIPTSLILYAVRQYLRYVNNILSYISIIENLLSLQFIAAVKSISFLSRPVYKTLDIFHGYLKMLIHVLGRHRRFLVQNCINNLLMRFACMTYIIRNSKRFCRYSRKVLAINLSISISNTLFVASTIAE